MATKKGIKTITKRLCQKLICLLMSLVLITNSSVLVFAQDTDDGKTIKVGYMNHPAFIEEDGNGGFVGYGAEYIEEICKHTGWNIEYVYASWQDQLTLLQNGEIDLVPMAQYSSERTEKYIYSQQSIGTIQGLLITLSEEENGIKGNALDCEGKTIGIMAGSRNIYFLQEYAKRMGFSYIQKEYEYQYELEEALLNKEVDIVACEQMIRSKEFRILDLFTSDPYYFITSKNNKALMDDLDYTISMINAHDPTYTSKLYNKYYGDSKISKNVYFSKEEAEYIENCDEITVVFIPGNKPFDYLDENGEMVGIFPDIMNKISSLSGLKFKYTFLPEDMTPIDYIRENPNSPVVGVLANNKAFISDEIILSDVYYSAYSCLAARKGFSADIPDNATICTPTPFQAMQLFIKEKYPNVNVVTYPTTDECMDALQAKEVDYFTYASNVILPYLASALYSDISIVDKMFMENPQCVVAYNTKENKMLIDIFDQCYSMIPEQEINQIEIDNLQSSTYHFDESDVFHRYQDTVLVIVILILAIISILVTNMFIRQRRFNKEITQRAEYDMMTGVYNRETLRHLINLNLRSNEGSRCCLLIFDMDDLKYINEAWGISAGDDAIKAMANIIKNQFRGSELIGRIEGDSFAVFMSGIESKTALVPILTNIQQTIASTSIMGGKCYLKASIGIAMGVAGSQKLDELYRQANEAVYRVKENGKNGFAFYESARSISINAINKQADKQIQQNQADLLNEEIFIGKGNNFEVILESFPNVSIYVIERSTHRILYFNRCFSKMCPNATLGSSCRNMMYGPCQNCIVDTMRERHMAHTIFYSDFYCGEVEITATKIMWDGGIPAVMISTWPRDLTSSSNDSLPGASYQNNFDYVSGGLTRSGFISMMERIQSGNVDLSQYAILFINIKDFKAVNEMVGSNGGDNLLRSVFARIENSELNPVIAARKESDHFVFMVEKSKLNLSTLPELLNFHWKYDDKDLFIHCRCGVFNIEDSELEVYKMIDRAKLAKDHIVDDYVQPYAVYNDSMLEEYSERALAYLMFDEGIKNNEFVVYYQPVIDAKTGKIASAEALVRRKMADGTIVSPGKFIPILERTGYISMLDKFVANKVSSFLNQRVDSNSYHVPISFNISQMDFYDDELMEHLAQSVENNKVPKGLLMFEVTESTYALTEKNHKDYLKRLRDCGAKILLDDFGVGYSSFGMFENYNFDRVKLDMSFVRKLKDNEKVNKVVESIVYMCHNLNIQVVAEGVETKEELDILKSINCDFIQGYYFSKPLDEDSFINYLNEHV